MRPYTFWEVIKEEFSFLPGPIQINFTKKTKLKPRRQHNLERLQSLFSAIEEAYEAGKYIEDSWLDEVFEILRQ